MSEAITRLSKLETGKNYKMESDDVACMIQVLHSGTSPICVVYGSFDGYGDGVFAPVVMQLVGWMAFPAANDDLTTIEQSFIHFDEKPRLAALVGAWYDPKQEYCFKAIATEPTITEL